MIDIHRCRFVDYAPNSITNVAFSHESTKKFASPDLRLAVGRNNGDIEIWNPKNRWIQETTLFGGKDRTIEGLVWSTIEGESPRLFSIGGSPVLTEWDLKTGLPLKNFDCNAAMIWSITINESQDKIALGCDDGTVVIVDISGGRGSIEHYAFLQRQENRVLCLAFNKNDYVIGGCADGRIRVWNIKQNDESSTQQRFNLIATMKVDKSKTESTLVWSIIYLPKRNQIVSGDSTGSVKFWDFEHFTLLQTYKVHEADVLTLTTDMENETLFTAGVDRKISKFQYILQEKASSKPSKWITSSNRLLHSNDIRSMVSYESKNFNFLVSAGVDKHIVISSLSNFTDGEFRKISFIPQQEHVIINKAKKLVVFWQGQTVKIWRLYQRHQDVQKANFSENEAAGDADEEFENSRESYQLVSKLTLADEENISTVAISQDGTKLAVGRLTTTKLFQLTEKSSSHKLKVSKIENLNLSNLGSRFLTFYGNDALVIATPDNEIYKFKLDDEDNSNSETLELAPVEYELSDLPRSRSKLPFLENINHLKVSHSKLVISRISGAIDVVELDNTSKFDSVPFLRLSSYVHKLEISPRFTLILITFENKIYEFDLKNFNSNHTNSHLTKWSKVNSEFLPREFTESAELPLGLFFDASNEYKVWVYGSNWLAFFDLKHNIPINKAKNDRKRNREGFQIGVIEQGEAPEGEEMEIDSDDEYEDALVDTARYEERLSILKKGGSGKGKAFWKTSKYRPILFASSLADTVEDSNAKEELIIVERPQFALSEPPAFKLKQFRL